MMVINLFFVPRETVGVCFLGFAACESLGASALSIAGGISTNIADIGSDLVRIVFNVKEDDLRNSGVTASRQGGSSLTILSGIVSGNFSAFWKGMLIVGVRAGASMQAVTTGAYRAVAYIKKNMDLDRKEADLEDSKSVVRICTEYAQSGMWNIFITLMAITLAFAFFDPNFFVAYLISIAVFGLFQAIYMANAGGAWDNAKKLVEVDFREKNAPVHAATVVGDTVGDPFKDTTSVALNPIIKFTTLFGLLAVEITVSIKTAVQADTGLDYTGVVGVLFLVVALFFVWRLFYAMRIPSEGVQAGSRPDQLVADTRRQPAETTLALHWPARCSCPGVHRL